MRSLALRRDLLLHRTGALAPHWHRRYAGVRGGIAFALSLDFPTKSRPVIVSTTIAIVLFTTVILGSLTGTVLKTLGLDGSAPQPSKPTEDDKAGETNRPRQLLKELDDKYLKAGFGGRPRYGSRPHTLPHTHPRRTRTHTHVMA